MLSKVHSLGLAGIAGYGVETECYIGTGLPAFELVGLPDASVKEARERVRAAVKNCVHQDNETSWLPLPGQPHHRESRPGGDEEIRYAL